MKRSPLKRTTKPMKRGRIKKKRRKGDDPDGVRTNYKLAHPWCALCWQGQHDVVVHHLQEGRGRKDVLENFLCLCMDCHRAAHELRAKTIIDQLLPPATKGMLLTCKREVNPDQYDPAVLAKLKGQVGLGYEPEPIHEYYLSKRRMHGCPH